MADDLVKREEMAVEHAITGMLPWQREFARWAAIKKRCRPDQLAKLFDLTGETWTWDRVYAMRKEPVFIEYYKIMKEQGLAAAKARMGELAYKAVEYTDWAMDEAKKAEDYSTMPKITGQVFERTMPRREDLMMQRMTININLNEKQRALIEATPIEVEAEELHD